MFNIPPTSVSTFLTSAFSLKTILPSAVDFTSNLYAPSVEEGEFEVPEPLYHLVSSKTIVSKYSIEK